MRLYVIFIVIISLFGSLNLVEGSVNPPPQVESTAVKVAVVTPDLKVVELTYTGNMNSTKHTSPANKLRSPRQKDKNLNRFRGCLVQQQQKGKGECNAFTLTC